MKEFKLVQYKLCPECSSRIDPSSKYAFDNNICPYCGFTTNYGTQTTTRKETGYVSSGYDDAVRIGLL